MTTEDAPVTVEPRIGDRLTFTGTGRVVATGDRFDRPPTVRLYLDGYGDVYVVVPIYLCKPLAAR